jgi:hypothetical protein
MVSRQELAREVSRRYAHAMRPEKSRILDEFVATTGYNPYGSPRGRQIP